MADTESSLQSAGEQPSGDVVESPQQPQALSREEVNQLLVEERKTFSSELEKAKRHFQSVADGQTAVERTQRQSLEKQLEALQGQYYETLEPEERVKVLQQKVQQLERDRTSTLAQTTYQPPQTSSSNMTYETMAKDLLGDYGIEANDPGIDWAKDVLNPDEGFGRFRKSVAKIVKEREKKVAEEAKRKVETEFEVGSGAPVSTAGPSGAGGREWSTKRFQALTPDQRQEHLAEVQKALREGRFKYD